MRVDVVCQCGVKLRRALLPIYCSCGETIGSAEDPAVNRLYETPHLAGKKYRDPCHHLGPIVGVADCDCQSKPSVYACGVHGLCLPRMTVTATAAILGDGTRSTVSRSCEGCEDREDGDKKNASVTRRRS